jgi:hypothetical protein
VTTPQYPFGEQPSDDDPFRQQDTFGSGSDQDDASPQDPYDPFARASRPAEQPAYYPPPQAGYGPPPPGYGSPMPPQAGPPQGPPRHTVRNIILGLVGAVVLVGVIAGVAVALSSGGGAGKPAASASRAATSAAAAAPTASAGTVACAEQLSTWQSGAGGQLLTKVTADASALGTDMGTGGSGAGSTSAGTKLAAQARQAAAHPMPSCVDPAGDYPKAMNQWSQAGTDAAAGNLAGEVTAFTQGTTDLAKATTEMNRLAPGN